MVVLDKDGVSLARQFLAAKRRELRLVRAWQWFDCFPARIIVCSVRTLFRVASATYRTKLALPFIHGSA